MLEINPLYILGFLFLLWFLSWIKILNEYERGVIFRLGRLLPDAKGPGVVLVITQTDTHHAVDWRNDQHDAWTFGIRQQAP